MEEFPGKVAVEEIVWAVCGRYSLSEDDLARPGKKQTAAPARAMAAWIVQDLPSVTLRELAERTGRNVSSLSAAAQRLQKRSKGEPELLREKEGLREQIAQCNAWPRCSCFCLVSGLVVSLQEIWV